MKLQKNKSRTFNILLSRFFLPAIASFILLSTAVAADTAEYVYISDNLRVGVRTEPVSGMPPISVVFTGMRLQVHERLDGYVKITTEKAFQVG